MMSGASVEYSETDSNHNLTVTEENFSEVSSLKDDEDSISCSEFSLSDFITDDIPLVSEAKKNRRRVYLDSRKVVNNKDDNGALLNIKESSIPAVQQEKCGLRDFIRKRRHDNDQLP